MSTTANHICVYNNCFKRQEMYKDLSFFKFPVKNSNRAEEWKKNCGNIKIALMNVADLRNKLICEKHFLPKDFLISCKRKMLTKTAVPIKFVEKDKEQLSTNSDAQSNTESFIIPLGSENDINFKASSSGINIPIKTYARKLPVSSSSDDDLLNELKPLIVFKRPPRVSRFSSWASSESKLSDRIIATGSPTRAILKKNCRILACRIKYLKNKLRARQWQTYKLKKKASFSTEKMNLKEVPGQRGNPLLLLNNFKYYKMKRLATGELKWHCVKKNCPSIVLTIRKNSCREVSKSPTEHNHTAEDYRIVGKRKNVAAKKKASENVSEPPGKIGHSIVNNLEEDILEDDSRKIYPTLPNPAEEALTALENM